MSREASETKPRPERLPTAHGVSVAGGHGSRQQALLQLQRTAGNRAVQQNLSRVARKQALPEALSGGIEALSGQSMQGVTVYRESAAPANVGADAYAYGSDIHLAPGMDRHLGHEAWHVAQQRAGCVSPTGAVGGQPLNDAPALEHEAERMGARAGTAGAPAVQSSRGAAESDPVLQRIVTQIVPENGKIKNVLIIGRPEYLYGNSMGDHSTAFIVQRNSVRLRLIGHTFDNALAGMDELVRGLVDLPGLHMIAQLDSEYRTRLHAAWEHMDEVRGTLPDSIGKPAAKSVMKSGTGDGPGTPSKSSALVAAPIKSASSSTVSTADTEGAGMQIETSNPWPEGMALNLQEYVNAYLEVREMVPFSAINVGALSKGLAGKGKGESGPGGLFYKNENGEPVPPEALKAAFRGLFDALSVTYMASQVGQSRASLATEMSPGFTSKSPIETRLKVMAGQHVVAIHQAFPTALKSMGLSASAASQMLIEQIMPMLKRSLLNEAQRLREQIEIGRGKVKGSQAEIAVLSKRATKKKQDALDYIEKVQGDMDVDDVMKGVLETELGRDLWKTVTAVDKLGEKEKPAPKKPAKKEAPSKAKKAKTATVEAEDAPEKEDTSAEDFAAAGLDANSMATQVTMTDDGRVGEIRFAGRTPSPFSGTMGAHTTSWVVHQDQIRTAAHGLTIGDAFASLTKLVSKPARTHETAMLKLFPLDASLLDDQKHLLALNGARGNLDKTEAGLTSATGAKDPYALQRYIGQLLTYVNFIPGATLDSADTGGKNEGKHHTFLVNFETGKDASATPEQLRTAINGLLDLKAVDEIAKGDVAKQKRELRKHHHALIAEVYPYAWAMSEIGQRDSLVAPRGEALGKATSDLSPDAVADSTGGMKRLPNKRLEKNSGKRQRKGAGPGDIDAWVPNFGGFGKFNPDDSLLNQSGFGEPFFGGMKSKPSPFGSYGGGKFKFNDNGFDFLGTPGKKRPGKGTKRDNSAVSGLTGGDMDEVSRPPLVTGDGTLTDIGRQQFLAAYRRDVAGSNAYLTEAEGHLIAKQLGIRVAVYKDHLPMGFTAVPNDGSGHCLIHALIGAREMLNSRKPRDANFGEILDVRKEVAEQLDPGDMTAMIAAAIESVLRGGGEPGLGAETRALLTDPSITDLIGTLPPIVSKFTFSPPVSGSGGTPFAFALPQPAAQARLGDPGALNNADVVILHSGGNHFTVAYRNAA